MPPKRNAVKNRFAAVSRALLLLGLCATARITAAERPEKVELKENWKLASAQDAQAEGAAISTIDYKDARWHPIRRMPATVLEILQEDGVYTDLYVGMNLLEKVPQDLYRQDWWYRTSFTAPGGQSAYMLEFPGINYRAEIWLNGHKIAGSDEVVGMYAAHEFNVTRWMTPGSPNALAVKVTPEQLIQDVDGVELADSWFDWINWKFLGYKGEKKKPSQFNASFVPDRNAGVWKPVYLRATGDVSVNDALVNTNLSVAKSTARLTIYASLHNLSAQRASGVLKASISRKGKPTIVITQSVALEAGEEREIQFTPENYPALAVSHPDLWWPYTLGDPALYDLGLEFAENGRLTDSSRTRFGIRSITQLRDTDSQFSDLGKRGNFYLQVNGRDFLVRGGDYTPDLLYRYDPDREAQILRYVKDLGINMLRWESKISSEHIIELADEQGIPVMLGWMCCNQWEKWDQWSEEDHRVASHSLRSQILMLRPHASAFLWANGSDGRPPEPVRQEYRKIISEAHWQNAVVDTVSSFARGPSGDRWDGIHMEGPYSWRPPTYWFSAKYPASRGSVVEQGDNEQIPTLESLKKFIPADKLWPINDAWYMHAGAIGKTSTLANIQNVLQRRYGASSGVEDFVRKAQLAHYEDVRAHFEAFAAAGWANHKVTMYWMLNSHWPSFYGNLIDYYLSPGGAYFGAKKGLRRLSVVFDSYAAGDHSQARIIVFNQTPGDVRGLRVRTRVYDLDGKLRDDRSADGIEVPYNGAKQVSVLPRYPGNSPVYFVRCQLFDRGGKLVMDNVYWQSQKDDDLGARRNDSAMDLRQDSWADMTALNTMPPAAVEVSATRTQTGGTTRVTVRVRNPTERIAFFARATVSAAREGNEILPIEYDDNYITVFPGETGEIHAVLPKDAKPGWVKLEGYNTPGISVPLR